MSRMLKSSGAIGAATVASRLLGMAREMVYAAFMGDGPVASAFKLAYMIPNLFRRLLGEGALTAAFIPIFKEKERTEGETEAWHAANAVISGMIASTAILIGCALIGISIALAWGSFSAQTKLMLELMRIMFPYLLLVCLAAIFMGMLNARGYFFVPAMGATTLNIVMIFTVVFVAPRTGETLQTQIFALGIGVLVAGMAQAGFQFIPLWRQGFRCRWVSPRTNPTVRTVVRRMIPGMMGVAAFQINVLITQSVAFKVDPNIVASFDYAVRLLELPQGVFAISLATFLLPTLAGMAAEKKFDQFRATLEQGLGYLILVNLLAGILLMVLAEPIVRLLFQRGAFDSFATLRASRALSCLAPALLAYSMVNILARAFFALGDTDTPMKISVVCLGINLICVLWLIGPYRQQGLGIANSMSATLNAALLVYALRRKLRKLDFSRIIPMLLPVGGAALVAGVAAWVSYRWWADHIGHTSFPSKLGEVFVPAVLSATAYFGLCVWWKVDAVRDMVGLIHRKKTPR